MAVFLPEELDFAELLPELEDFDVLFLLDELDFALLELEGISSASL